MSMNMNMNLAQLAAETVACFRADFPGQLPGWGSVAWREAWRLDCEHLQKVGGLCEEPRFPTYQQYLEACQREWSLISNYHSLKPVRG